MNTIALQKSEAEVRIGPDLLAWYDVHARAMPWRVSPNDYAAGVRQDPYKVWLSEVMLQQTQVITVQNYFLAFVETWPTVEDLAAADLEDVLKAWAGLGYYSRARNLKKCADLVVSQWGGRFPRLRSELIGLPGIGDYTASAIAAIAFDEAVPVVDGNVERVVARVFRITTPFPNAKKNAAELVAAQLDQTRPGEFAQAMMDLGATLCTPKGPRCNACPISHICMSSEAGDVEQFPVKRPKKKKPTRRGAAFVIVDQGNNVWLCKRPMSGLLAGMTQVPTTDWNSNRNGATGKAAAPVGGEWQSVGTIRHTFTHFHLELEVWKLRIDHTPRIGGWWCNIGSIDNEALPSVMQKAVKFALD